ncbi:DUF2442 domain-containing protein [Altererythrobacter xixiisoli]|uniref:DUF2442 domain-containing protein n=2 Tax=Croceibacterium xixiisoli TaxID=1476466 RepID=A0A6I4TV06_9SPHN|nr:DUF2442 domain-containing protein [Croceibacterium xixiisoli]
MNISEKARTIAAVQVIGRTSLRLSWSDETQVDLDLAAMLDDPALAGLRDEAEFASVAVGDWGHSLVWPSGIELGADTLWLETLSAKGTQDVRLFLEWRLRHGLSLTKAAEALGISRRMVAYYSNGEKQVPKAILLACRGWEVSQGTYQAA